MSGSFAHLGREAVDRLADGGEEARAVDPRRVQRPDEPVLRRPPVQPARARGLRGVAHARGGGLEPLLGEPTSSSLAAGSSFTTERFRMASKTAWSSAEAMARKPTSPAALQVLGVDRVGDERRVPGALVDDVRRRRVLDVLVRADVGGDGEHPPALELGEDRGRDEAAHRHRGPAHPRELRRSSRRGSGCARPRSRSPRARPGSEGARGRRGARSACAGCAARPRGRGGCTPRSSCATAKRRRWGGSPRWRARSGSSPDPHWKLRMLGRPALPLMRAPGRRDAPDHVGLGPWTRWRRASAISARPPGCLARGAGL